MTNYQVSTIFRARIWLSEESVEDVDVWVHELVPVDEKSRPSEDWVREHFELLKREDWLEYAKLPTDEDRSYQLLVTGRLSGWYTSTHAGEDWDEELTIDDITHQQLPDDWFGLKGGEDDDATGILYGFGSGPLAALDSDGGQGAGAEEG